jgi:hypothetical protein
MCFDSDPQRRDTAHTRRTRLHRSSWCCVACDGYYVPMPPRTAWLLMVIGGASVFAGHGCDRSTQGSSPDAAVDAPVPSGGTACGGASGGGGTKGGGGSGAIGDGGRAGGGAGGISGLDGVGLGGSARTGGATGVGGRQGGGDAQGPGGTDTVGGFLLDGSIEGGSQQRCVGSPSRISCQSDSAHCSTIPGCRFDWPDTGNCLSSRGSCASKSTSAAACGETIGCDWISPATCSGEPSLCNKHSLGADCLAQPGCTWTPPPDGGTCFADPDPCRDNDSEPACSAQMGCTWSNAVCISASNACLGKSTAAACLAVQDCAWRDSSESCSGTPRGCWVNSTSTACTAAGCSWFAQSACMDAGSSCASLTTKSACEAGECSWRRDDLRCMGTPTPCDQLSFAECASQAGCTVASP